MHCSPTPYTDVNEILHLLLANIKATLKDQFVGMYLYGSLASGDFDPATSDIDFLVVTKDILPQQIIVELEIMHYRIWNSGLKWASKLEGAYIPQKDIRRHTSESKPCPTVNEGKFYLSSLGSDWLIQRHIVRERGVVLEGPDPKTLIDPISPNDLHRAVLGILREWWFPMLENPTWLKERKSNYHGYAVITMCRALYTLKNKKIISKPKAIEWAKEKLNGRWRPLIEQAVASQYGQESDFLNETLEMIRYTLSESEKYA
ncbi:MAG TPA: aminoglycoside adenylyltransferase domain-containing protein [Anaerolineales bacterium]|nr:aminoglycoside adenylyltransferase domain-containing protein [Anaerolineales bacterium]